MEFENEKRLFELWVNKQFPGEITPSTLEWEDKVGYTNINTNTMFVSFTAGYIFGKTLNP